MTVESDAFEQLNARIARLVQGHGATVFWNYSIPDPDSPSDSRQIDVMIQTDDGRSLSVECRHRTSRQNVMWIEELVGRKLSLGLDSMIAVSVGGFSSLAQKKAKRFGIVLYDFNSLTDEEIASWTDAAKAEASFVQFDSLEILAFVPQAAEPTLSAEPILRFDGKDGYGIVMDRIRDDALAQAGARRSFQLDPFGFTVDGVPLTRLGCVYAARLVTVTATCTAVSSVGAPGNIRSPPRYQCAEIRSLGSGDHSERQRSALAR